MPVRQLFQTVYFNTDMVTSAVVPAVVPLIVLAVIVGLVIYQRYAKQDTAFYFLFFNAFETLKPES